jgi:hypothetical protein
MQTRIHVDKSGRTLDESAIPPISPCYVHVHGTLHTVQRPQRPRNMPGPDENVHPEATGEAKKLVDAHQDAQDLVFYSGWVRLRIRNRSSLRPGQGHVHGQPRLTLMQFCPFNQVR